MQRISFVFGIGLILATGLKAQSSGYRLTSNQIVVDSRQHWRNWDFPVGTLEIDEVGTITPSFLRRNTNATEDILDFLRLHPPKKIGKEPEEIVLIDAIQAGSNGPGVLNVIDGDMETYWQPDPPESEVELGTQWWFTVDLGRLVIAKRIVLKFVEEGNGDPFLQYDVLISDGEVPEKFVSSDEPSYNAVWRTLKPNKNERVLEISLGKTEEAEAEQLSSQPINAPPTTSPC